MDKLSDPWPWYIAGPLIGLFVPLLLLVLNKPFGVSSTMRDFCAMCMPNTRVKFFQYNWKERSWNLLFVLGIVIGSALVFLFLPNPEVVEISEGTIARLESQGITDRSGLVPPKIFSWETLSSPLSLIMICLGGFFVGFGTRYAGGCTSGHGIMGSSMFKPASFVAMTGFFIGGLIMTWLVFPYLMQLL